MSRQFIIFVLLLLMPANAMGIETKDSVSIAQIAKTISFKEYSKNTFEVARKLFTQFDIANPDMPLLKGMRNIDNQKQGLSEDIVFRFQGRVPKELYRIRIFLTKGHAFALTPTQVSGTITFNGYNLSQKPIIELYMSSRIGLPISKVKQNTLGIFSTISGIVIEPKQGYRSYIKKSELLEFNKDYDYGKLSKRIIADKNESSRDIVEVSIENKKGASLLSFKGFNNEHVLTEAYYYEISGESPILTVMYHDTHPNLGGSGSCALIYYVFRTKPELMYIESREENCFPVD